MTHIKYGVEKEQLDKTAEKTEDVANAAETAEKDEKEKCLKCEADISTVEARMHHECI